MRHTKARIFTGTAFFLAWIFFLILTKNLKDTLLLDPAHFRETSKILLLYLNVPLFFIWLMLGFSFGLPVIFITCLFITALFEMRIYAFPLLSLIIISSFGYRLNRVFERKMRNLQINREKSFEASNLLSEQIKSGGKNNLRMKNSFKKISDLKNIVENYSQTPYEKDILDSIVKNSFELFKDANRILLYLVDVERQELMLARSRKRGIPFPVRAKKGDVFDRWVLKHRMPLLVEDIHNDFRFSLEEELDKGFNAIISIPFTGEHRVLGILRIDSAEKGKFTQSDLRLLDIIADLSSVSLQNAILYKKVQDLAVHDSLTGLYVHKYFIGRLNNEIGRSLRNDRDISLLMLDLDNFKSYNDKYGHNAGDLVLKHISSILEAFAQPDDIVARYGGEEFAILLLNKTKATATQIAENIRKRISSAPVVLRRQKTSITVSAGVASCPSEANITEELLRLADLRLYKAKEKGKNQVWAG